MSVELAKTPVILLAAGNSSRMGEPKGLLESHGHAWLEEQLKRLAETGLTEAIVVLGNDRERYASKLPWLKGAIGSSANVAGIRVLVAVNPQPELGQFSSLQTGSSLVHAEVPAVWVLPIDVPCPKSSTWNVLAAAEGDACLPVFKGRGGHPVRLSREFLQRLATLPPAAADSRLDVQIHHLPSIKSARVDVEDPSVTRNMNTPEEWALH